MVRKRQSCDAPSKALAEKHPRRKRQRTLKSSYTEVKFSNNELKSTSEKPGGIDQTIHIKMDPQNPASEGPRLMFLSTPPGFSLAQSVCSYGYFGLAPNTWMPSQPHGKEGPLENRLSDSGCYKRPLRFGVSLPPPSLPPPHTPLFTP
jgi:hypothetical protein